MTKRYFGTDGIRGRVGDFPMTADFALKLGWAAGKVMRRGGAREVLIGKDTRASGYMLESALEAGFSSAGMDIALVGPLPTPGVAYLASTFRSDGAVMISASHNPYYDNGIKIFGRDGQKLSDAQEQEIEHYLEIALSEGSTCVSPEKLGKARRIEDASGRYTEYCKAALPSAISLEGLKIVVDCANGAAYRVAPAVYRELGASVIAIHNQPDGFNINRDCGATSLESLCAAVVSHGADLGIALDGDADRLIMVDHGGMEVDGDELLYLLARQSKFAGYQGGVVGTQMSNLGLEQALAALGIPFQRSKVGDRYVKELMDKTGWRLGGETSGHLLNLDYAPTGDAIVASMQLLACMVKEGVSLQRAKQGMIKKPQTLINVSIDGESLDEVLASHSVVQAVKDIEHELGQEGRVLLRKSGTEPLIRVMVEANEELQARKAAEKIALVLQAY